MDLFDSLTLNSTILTPNRRLSAVLLKKHHTSQIAQNKTCWQSADILPITSWLQRLWLTHFSQQMTAMPILLSSNQEQILWEEILRQSAENEYLLQLASTAELAKSAWGTLKQWRVALDSPALTTTEDGLIFQRWAKKFASRCREHQWIDTSSLADNIIEKIQAGDIIPPAQIVLTGFTEISPQYQYLFTVCEQFGSTVTQYESQNINETVHRLSLHDQETEIRSMARWAKDIYKKNPGKTIGCIVPRLEKFRDRIIQIFSEVLSDENTYTLNPIKLPFNISAGKNLSLYPVIHTALQILSLQSGDIPIAVLGNLLRSPFIGAAETESMERAQFDSIVRKANVSTISIRKLTNKNSRLALEKSCPLLAKQLQDYLSAHCSAQATPSIWVETFMARLNALGWPGERSLNSQEYQVVDAWLKLLAEFAAFDNLLRTQTDKQALHYLTYLTTKMIFQPESPETPIQLLGMLEAAELPFDYLWVMGLDDREWPPAPQPNPFIPLRLQKTMHMPHANAERELVYCEQLTKQLKRSASEIIFSHAQQDEDTELRVSPIIASLPEIKLEQLELSDFISPAQRLFLSKKLEVLQDDKAPAVSPDEKILGGATLFKLQAACAFKAFAELRLHAKPIDPLTPGLKPQDRGKIVHKALEMIWNTLKNSEELERIDALALQQLIQQSADKAIALADSEAINYPRFRQLESARLQKLLHEWLQLEKLRPPFKVIAQEKERTVTFANMTMTLRIDRIDQLENGKTVVIDYKTSKNNSIKYWFGDRPEEPQLPLYCVTDPDTTIGILFAQINAEKTGFLGISELEIGIPSIALLSKSKDTDAVSWKAQIEQWHSTLEKLGNDYFQGHAEVAPKSLVDTCQYCHLHALCRIHESIEQ